MRLLYIVYTLIFLIISTSSFGNEFSSEIDDPDLKKKLKIFIRQSILNKGSTLYAETGERADILLQAYSSYTNAFYFTCYNIPRTNPDVWRIQYGKCIHTYLESHFNRITSSLLNQTPEKLLSFYRVPNANLYKNFTTRETRLIQEFHRLLTSPSEKIFLDQLFSLGKSMNTEDKLALVQMFGTIFHLGYDKERAKKEIRTKGTVNLFEMVSAGLHNVRIRFSGVQEDPLSYFAQFKGVCRDIASGLGKMLVYLGFPKTYVISRGHPGKNSLYHSSVISLDPDHQKTLYHIDYGEGHITQTGSAASLFTGEKDAAITYWISIPGGMTIDNIQSEFGKFLTEAAGFDIRRIDPLSRNYGSLFSFEANPFKDHKFSFRGGYGTDILGAQYIYSGATSTWGENKFYPGKISILFGSQIRNRGTFKNFNHQRQMAFLYLHLEQILRTKKIRITKNILVQIESYATMIFLAGIMTHYDENRYTVQADARTGINFKLYHYMWKKRFLAEYVFGAQIGPGIRDVRNNYIWQKYIATLNHLLFSVKGRLDLGKTRAGRACLLAATTVLYDLLGFRGRVETGLKFGDFDILLQMEGRLSDATVPIQDGSERQLVLYFAWNAGNYIKLVLSSYMSLDHKGRAGIIGSTIISF